MQSRNKLIRLKSKGFIFFSFGPICDSWLKVGHSFPGNGMKPIFSTREQAVEMRRYN
jgi:hypothetical protein